MNANALSTAIVVGIGESTRFAHETFTIRDDLFRDLVENHNFRTLAVQDSADVGETLDAYVRHGKGTATSALDNAWRPWRTAEMAAALTWIREFNQAHPGDEVHIIGIKPVQAQPEDYDAILNAVRVQAPDRLAELAAHLDPIRTAHTLDEHVQRAQGIHPGRRFLDHARDASALIAEIPGLDESIRARMALIEEFHAHSVTGRGSFAGEADLWASSIIEHHRRTGLRTVYWDGISHVSAVKDTVGSVLRDHFGRDYASVAIGFHHGDVGVYEIPAPTPDSLDAELGERADPTLWLDMRTDPITKPTKMRVISGIYDPARDADGYTAVDNPAEAFDVLIHVREVTPLTWLA